MSEVSAPRFGGLSLAALTLGVIGLIIAVGCWIAWAVMIVPADMPVRYYSSGSPLLSLAIGALWAAMVPTSALAVIYGVLSQRRNRTNASGRDGLARTGTVTGLIALLIALAGSGTFAWSVSQTNMPPPVLVPMPAATPTN